MMKKFLMVVACMCLGICAFALPSAPKNFDWNSQDANQINSWIAEEQAEKDLHYVNVIEIQKALIGKNDKNITYVEFKSIVNKIANNDYKTYAVPQFVYCVQRFRGFAKDVIKDSDYGVKNNYVATWLILIENALSPEEFRNQLVTFLPKMKKDYNLAINYIRMYEVYSISYTDEEIKSDMKKIKKMIYSNISINENWKKLVIKIELILKSIE